VKRRGREKGVKVGKAEEGGKEGGRGTGRDGPPTYLAMLAALL